MPAIPRVYLDTRGVSRDISRSTPAGARVAVHYPEIGRTVELQTDAAGHYELREMPAPMMSGEEIAVYRGQLSAHSIPGSRAELLSAFDTAQHHADGEDAYVFLLAAVARYLGVPIQGDAQLAPTSDHASR
jgi:hypothetical protein